MDNLVFEIIGKESPIITGFGVTDSLQTPSKPKITMAAENEAEIENVLSNDEDDNINYIEQDERKMTNEKMTQKSVPEEVRDVKIRKRCKNEECIDMSLKNRKMELQVRSLELNNYKMQLEILTLERKLEIPPSKFTSQLHNSFE